MAKTEEHKRRFVQLRGVGYSYRRIAEMMDEEGLKVSKNTLIAWGQDMELASRIRVLRDAAFDDLLEEYEVSRRQRVARLAHRLREVDVALGERDLKSVPVGELMRIHIRYMDAVRAEVEPMAMMNSTAEVYRSIITSCSVALPGDPLGSEPEVDQNQTTTEEGEPDYWP